MVISGGDVLPKLKFVFQRKEKKYRLSPEKYNLFESIIKNHMNVDCFGTTTVCNLYYDTPNMRIIRASIEHPRYKEKLRLRTYGIPNESSDSFIELKKKYDGTVFKRRLCLPYKKAVDLLSGEMIACDNQVFNEIKAFMSFYKSLSASIALFYERTAWISPEDENLRITIDKNIRWRENELDLTLGDHAKPLDANEYILEIKTIGSMPLWLCRALSELEIFPSSYSKYGNAYKCMINEKQQSSL